MQQKKLLGTKKGGGIKSKMKVLYIGHYKEGSGWSEAAINYILSATKSNIDIVCRNIKLNNNPPAKIDPIISELENKDLNNIDYCIQHVLPHHLVSTNKFKKNIAYFAGESNTLKYNIWIDYLNKMDFIWVPNSTLKTNLISDGLSENRVRVIPHAFDLSKYQYKNSNINFGPNNYKFKFYYIGEWNDRKNLESIIRCFHSEFANYEPVSLVLKVKKPGINSNDVSKHIENMCSQIKSEMRIYPNINDYHSEIIISDNMTNDQIHALHNACDCFIGPSHGEGWSIPAFEAMCYGKTPICSNEGGTKEFIDQNNKDTGYLIDGTYSICNHSDSAFPHIFTGKEEWFQPSESEVKKAMRYYYENRNNIDRLAGIKNAERFSYENIGKVIKDNLND
jgi:glycosyltransferase involved in cell wall biosynthesis